MRRAHSPPVVLLAASIALGALAATPVVAVESNTPLWRVPLEALSSTRERPLFTQSRRPPPPAVVAAPPPPPPPPPPVAPQPDPPPAVVLLGVLLGPENLSVAIIQDPGEAATKRLRVGDSYKNWILADLKVDSAVLSQGDRSVTLQMKKPGGDRGPTVPGRGRQIPGFPAGAPQPMPQANAGFPAVSNVPGFPPPPGGVRPGGGLPGAPAPGLTSPGTPLPGQPCCR